MKLQLVTARAGVLWVRQGIRTFLRQPLALMGLFFMFMASLAILSLVPVVGNVLELVLLPVASLGLMVASAQAAEGRFPMPHLLIAGLRQGAAQTRAMLVLGLLYAGGFLALLAVSALADGGKFARVYLLSEPLSANLVMEPDFQLAVLVGMLLYVPFSMAFWHAPALVHWQGVSPVKSLFFSLVACKRNFWAFSVYTLAWLGVFMGVGTAVALVAGMLDSAELLGNLMFPATLVMASMFFTSMLFSYRACFEQAGPDAS